MTDITKRLAEALRRIVTAPEWDSLPARQAAVPLLAEYDRARPAPEPTVRYRSPRNIVTSRPLGVPSDYTFSEPQTLEELRAELDPTPAPASGEVTDGCPCLFTIPCDPMCTCVEPTSSRGCSRCCKYGSEEQRTAMAEHLAALEAATRARQDVIPTAAPVPAKVDCVRCGNRHSGGC